MYVAANIFFFEGIRGFFFEDVKISINVFQQIQNKQDQMTSPLHSSLLLCLFYEVIITVTSEDRVYSSFFSIFFLDLIYHATKCPGYMLVW